MTMYRNPYTRFQGQKLTLNDYLAIDRTILANERTLLAYGRTALAMAVVGASAIKFFDAAWIIVTGVAFIVIGILITIRGWQRYQHTRRLLAAALSQQTGAPEHPLAEEIKPQDKEARKTEPAEAPPPT